MPQLAQPVDLIGELGSLVFSVTECMDYYTVQIGAFHSVDFLADELNIL